jgi:hypothetical protein
MYIGAFMPSFYHLSSPLHKLSLEPALEAVRKGLERGLKRQNQKREI